MNLDKLIDESVKKSPAKNKDDKDTLAEVLIKNADKALGLDNIKLRKGSMVKNLTFALGLDEVKNIDFQIERFLKHGKNVNKSELIRIGLKLIENVEDDQLAALTELIIKHPKGRQNY